MKLRPLGNKIVLEPIDPPETRASGLVIPKKSQTATLKGKVLAVGPGKFDKDGEAQIPCICKVGNIVLFEDFTGQKVEIEEKKYVVVSEDHIIAVVDE